MRVCRVLFGVVVAAGMAAAGAASAAVVSVSATSGPWNQAVAGNPAYGVGDQTAPTVVAVNPGDTLTITYLSGLTSAFGGVAPTVDALGYTFDIFGSGQGGGCPITGCTGVGSSGTFFPSHAIDPSNTGPQIALNALIGAFVDSSGMVLGTPFAPGDGPATVIAPAGAVALQLGVNDDIFTTGVGPYGSAPASIVPDNTGALSIDVSGSTVGVVPEPASLALLGAGFLALGAIRRRARR
jgi:hypothetical protein